MCFEPDSRPPITPIAGASVEHRDLELTAADGNRFAAFCGLAEVAPGVGIVVLPDVRGLYPYYEELTLRFAEAGFDAVAIDYFGRTAGVAKRGDDFDYMTHVNQGTWPGLRADASAAVAWLRSERGAQVVFTVGFCFGGRLSFDLGAEAELALSGVIGFYGTLVGPGRAGMPSPVELASFMRAPVLGLFGGADQAITAEAVALFDEALTKAGVERELVVYPEAPHSFFDRKYEEFAEESADAWQKVLAFMRAYTPADQAAAA